MSAEGEGRAEAPPDLAAVPIPTWVRAEFAHAVVQTLADHVGAQVLHLKGAATDVDLRTRPDGGTDADILVCPGQVHLLLDALWAHGWTRYSSFETGSPFEHATTALHPVFLFADIHRFIPGIDTDPTTAFTTLWDTRGTRQIGGVTCAIPERTARVLVHVLDHTRSRRRRFTREQIAELLPEGDLRGLEAMVARLEAEVGYAAAVGELERHRGARTYLLWRSITTGGSRTQEWRARVRAADTIGAKIRLLWRAGLVNTDHLGHRLGRRPRPLDIAREFVNRPLRGLRLALGGTRAQRTVSRTVARSGQPGRDLR